ncbi:OsmC family protein [Acidisoma sp. L85]|uniref:OsmC family protein n=1 Tax=Acidisoma sp. L85 TaxID=1641850 RepID=UPI00352ABFB0
MTQSVVRGGELLGAVVVGDFEDGALLTGSASGSAFLVGGPDGRGGTTSGLNPYDLLSASLAACTAITIRLYARHKRYPLSRVEVAVSFHHAIDGGRDFFERAIALQGGLDEDQHADVLRIAVMCPVGKTLGMNADIHTRSEGRSSVAARVPASYSADLADFGSSLSAPVENCDDLLPQSYRPDWFS